MPILSAIGSPSAAGATAPSICCLTSVSVAPSIAVAPDPPLEVGSFVPFSDFDVETISHVTARRHTDAFDVVLTGARTRLTAARITAWHRRGGFRRAP